MVENNIAGVCCMSKNSPYFDNIFQFLYKTISALLIFYEPAELQLNILSTIVLCFYMNKKFLELYFLDVNILFLFFGKS
jgi:hypothetical protein